MFLDVWYHVQLHMLSHVQEHVSTCANTRHVCTCAWTQYHMCNHMLRSCARICDNMLRAHMWTKTCYNMWYHVNTYASTCHHTWTHMCDMWKHVITCDKTCYIMWRKNMFSQVITCELSHVKLQVILCANTCCNMLSHNKLAHVQ